MIKVINHSEITPSWNWLESRTNDPNIEWGKSTTESYANLNKLPKGYILSRVLAAREALNLSHAENSILVSHGPKPSFYSSILSSAKSHPKHHLAFSFNFTELPNQTKIKLYAKAYKKIDRFVVASTFEKSLYSNAFDIDPDKIDVLLWAVNPYIKENLKRLVPEGRYFCAVGAQGRDYRTLMETMRRMPSCHLHLVAYQENIAGIEIPKNVTVHLGVTFEYAAAIVAYSDAMILPLAGNKVPCGHVTTVMAMHLGIPIMATDSLGLNDYLRQSETAELFEQKNPDAICEKMASFMDDSSKMLGYAKTAKTFAADHCLEQNTVDYFKNYVYKCYGHTPVMR